MATRTPRRNIQPPPEGDQPAIENQPQTSPQTQFEEVSVPTKCSGCGIDTITVLEYEIGNLSWTLCFIVALSGFCLGCCFVPFCLKTTKDVLHKCPDCKYTIARFNKM
ncbi:LITAF domain-containing protein-like [Argopecten irradians]|uniref:LITAF domain-containing protein-like n=1 Tax=Argopecten irradians TaxID=31199 RepID=UPI003720EA4A